MNTKVKKSLIFVILCACFAFADETAYADRAPFLDYRPAYMIFPDSMGMDFINMAEARATEDLVNTQPQGEAEFVHELAEDADLIDCGVFADTDNAYQVFMHLTKDNQYASFDLLKCKQFGGSEYSILSGDLIFFLNENKRPVACVIVLERTSDGIVCAASYEGQSGRIYLDDKSEELNKNARVVHMIYPYAEQIIFSYLRDELCYNETTSSGILADIYAESLFSASIEETANRRGYGLCQWTGERRHSLTTWCEENGKRVDHLYPQLEFMKKELKSEEFKELDSMIRNVTRNGDGAYDAAHAFCYYYLKPDNYIEVSEERGALAQDLVYPAYQGLYDENK